MGRQRPSKVTTLFSCMAFFVSIASMGLLTLRQVPIYWYFAESWRRELHLEKRIYDAGMIQGDGGCFDDSQRVVDDFASSISVPSTIKSKVKILLVMGLEGTGHQLFEELALVSPHLQRLKDLEIHPKDTKRLATLVGDGQASLWMAPCNAKSKMLSTVPQIQNRVIDLLQSIEQKALQEHDGNNNSTLTIPFNVIQATKTKLSYPNMGGPCRALQHPNLDVWYETCNQAGIRCEHVYIYRDPYEILYSTVVKRKYNPSLLQAIQLYTTMLNTVYMQLLTHADRTAGCFGLMTPGMDHAWRNEIRGMLGWQQQAQENDVNNSHMNQNQTSTTTFDAVFRSIYKLPQPLSQETNQSFIPAQYESHMKSLVRANDAVKSLCHKTISNQRKRKTSVMGIR